MSTLKPYNQLDVLKPSQTINSKIKELQIQERGDLQSFCTLIFTGRDRTQRESLMSRGQPTACLRAAPLLTHISDSFPNPHSAPSSSSRYLKSLASFGMISIRDLKLRCFRQPVKFAAVSARSLITPSNHNQPK